MTIQKPTNLLDRVQILLKGTSVGRVADAWSAGVALYALLNGAFPFARNEDNCENEVLRQPSNMQMHAFRLDDVP